MCLARGIYSVCVNVRRLKIMLWQRRHFVGLGVLLIFPLLAACSGPSVMNLQAFVDEKKDTAGEGAGWKKEVVEVEGWQIAVVRKDAGPVRRIYIEGDGHAFIDRNTPSFDPTPLNPVALKLVMNDTGAGVMYVARPCQWGKGPECADRTLWTDKRFTQAVVDRYVELVARESAEGPVELVGYSGGAWVAIQVAARLPNVTSVVTVGGNLMPEWVNAEHHATAIEVVPYPAPFIPVGRELPITAYVGKGDTVVGRGVVAAFEAAAGVKVKVVEVDATHGSGWENLRL